MKYKDNRNIWDYIPYIVIAVAVFTIIWWSIVLNSMASGLVTVSGYYGMPVSGNASSIYLPTDNNKVWCAVRANPQTYTINETTYTTYVYTLVSNNSELINVTRLYDGNSSEIQVRMNNIGDGVYSSQPNMLITCNLTGIPLFSTIDEAKAYIISGDETGNLNHTPAPNYGGSNIPVPEGYYGQYTNIGTLHTYDDVYKNQLILTNYSPEYKVAVCYRIRYASDIKVKRESSTSIYVDVWHDSVKYKEWHVQSNWYDNAVPEYDNGVYYVTQAIDSTTAEAIKNEVMATYTNYDVTGNLNASNLFPTLKGKLSDEYYNNLAGDRFFMWQVMDYTVQYYKVEANGDMTFGDIATFSIEMPYLLKWNILRNGFFTMPDGYGQTSGVVSGLNSGSITTDTVLTGDSYALNTGSETSSGIGNISGSLNVSSANITEMTNTLNNFKVFVGNVPNVMATWFGFMPNWIWSLIALEFGFLIVFGIIKKIVG